MVGESHLAPSYTLVKLSCLRNNEALGFSLSLVISLTDGLTLPVIDLSSVVVPTLPSTIPVHVSNSNT